MWQALCWGWGSGNTKPSKGSQSRANHLHLNSTNTNPRLLLHFFQMPPSHCWLLYLYEGQHGSQTHYCSSGFLGSRFSQDCYAQSLQGSALWIKTREYRKMQNLKVGEIGQRCSPNGASADPMWSSNFGVGWINRVGPTLHISMLTGDWNGAWSWAR